MRKRLAGIASDLLFKPLRATDAGLIVDSWGSKVDNFKYLSSPLLNSIKAAQSYIEKTLAAEYSLAYHIAVHGNIVGLVKAIADGHRAQVGYVIDQAYWGQGIATEAVEFITELLCANNITQRIWATCALDNVGSQRVLEKCDYQREGILKNWIIYPAQGRRAHDNYVYSYPKKPNIQT